MSRVVHTARSLVQMTLLAVTLALGVGPAEARATGCITRLPASAQLPSAYAAEYRRDITVTVRTRGPLLRRTYASLYTFSGRLIARSRVTNVRSSKRLRMRLRHGPMQTGSFTLVVTGEPNKSRSCGPKTYVRVVRFRSCTSDLPVAFPSPPGGYASDYEDILSVPIRTLGPFLQDVQSAVYGFDGRLMGRAHVDALFGETTLDHELIEPLTPGRYTVVVDAEGGQPAACGLQRATLEIGFG